MVRQRLLFLVDFDETLTRTGQDTISRLASAAYAQQQQQHPRIPLPPWSHFVESYMRDYDQHTRKHPPETRQNLGAEREFLTSLKAVERESINRVEASGLFKGLDLPTLLGTAVGDRNRIGELMRGGWWGAIKKVLEREGAGKVVVVSVNWSRGWIRECLRGSVQPEEDTEAKVRSIEVYANEFVVKEDGRTTTGALDRWFGQGDGGIWTGWDKMRVMRDIIQSGREGPEEEERERALVVYVGDSATDLLCLLEADVGVVFGHKLDGVCMRLGVEIQEGFSGLGNVKRDRGRLIRIVEWKELELWIDTV